jgi:hypothetical protein
MRNYISVAYWTLRLLMAQLQKLIAAFRACSGPYPWSDFEAMIELLGYKRLKASKTSGSRRKFRHPETRHKIMCHEPHNGEMGPRFVKEMQENLKRQGLL